MRRVYTRGDDRDPDFVYAARDLAELEAKLTGWSTD
jgi:hypothetical protein